MKLAEKLRSKQIKVIISNHNTKQSQQLYKSASSIEQFEVQRYISCIGEKRVKANELLVVY